MISSLIFYGGRRWFGLAVIALFCAQTAFADVTDNNISITSSPTTNNVHAFTLERQLADKTVCRITVRGQSGNTNMLDTVDGVDISLEGCKVLLPAKECSGWTDFYPSSGLQIDETGRTQRLVLTGGKPDARWHVKLTLQNGTLTEWHHGFERRLPKLAAPTTQIDVSVVKMPALSISNHADLPTN
jgi:hypothetical protein